MREPTPVGQIDIWRASSSETQCLEFKEAKNQFDNETLFQYCVAMANEGGGYLLLGVSNAPPRRVVGTSAFRDPIKMEEKLFQNLGFRVDVEEVQHSDGRVVVFHIPSRPRGTAFNRKGSYLMRSGECLVPMSEDQLRKIFAEGKPGWLEQYAAKDLSADDVLDLLHVSAYFELLPLPFTSKDAAIDRLRSDNLIDAIDGKYAIPRSTALLLARHLSVFSELERKQPRVIVYNGTSKLDTKLERTAASKRGY
jgi:predicted HTH transcriptional regulator